MAFSTSRREFVNKICLASGGLVLSSSYNLNAFNKDHSPFEGYNPYADSKVDLRTSHDSADHIRVAGKIYSRNRLVLLPNIKLEIWHLSQASNKYRHQAKIKTNELGEFQFLTDLPGREPGKNPRIYFKVTGENRSYFTELIIGIHYAYVTEKHWAENHCLEERMQPIKNKSNIQFNLAI